MECAHESVFARCMYEFNDFECLLVIHIYHLTARSGTRNSIHGYSD